MKKLMGIVTAAVVIALVIGVIGGGIYGFAKLGKTLSYGWWYRDMVQQTIRDMVKDSALK